MPRYMLYSGFGNFDDASKFVFGRIIKECKPTLATSKMKIAPNFSQGSKSTYIVLSYINKFTHLDPLYGKCFPYVIRVSDHKINNPFSLRDANHTIIVNPQIGRREKERIEFIRREVNKLKMNAYIIKLEERNDVTKQIFEKQDKINKILGKYKYEFEADFSKINLQIKNILKVNQKD